MTLTSYNCPSEQTQ